MSTKKSGSVRGSGSTRRSLSTAPPAQHLSVIRSGPVVDLPPEGAATSPAYNAASILDRLKASLSLDKEVELARALDITTSLLANWRRRNHLDFNKVLPVASAHGIDLNWLVFGRVLNRGQSIDLIRSRRSLRDKRIHDIRELLEELTVKFQSIDE